VLLQSAFRLFVLAVVGGILLFLEIVRSIGRHRLWRNMREGFPFLTRYQQIHYSIGFWAPIHLLMDIILIVTSAYLWHESTIMTAFVSMWGLRVFSFGFFAGCFVACRWFSFKLEFYELVLIMRVSFSKLVSVLAGLLPLICALMMIGLFLFGLVSDISKTYYRFIQLFLGLIFGDDMYAVYSYYTDGSDAYNYMAFVFVTAIGVVAGYIFFPAFTATISSLRTSEVVPIVTGVPWKDED
jgi:hypothetical protein